MGFGVGGEYPLSAAYTAEQSGPHSSGRMLSTVFVMFGVGEILASIVVLISQLSGASKGTVRVSFYPLFSHFLASWNLDF